MRPVQLRDIEKGSPAGMASVHEMTSACIAARWGGRFEAEMTAITTRRKEWRPFLMRSNWLVVSDELRKRA